MADILTQPFVNRAEAGRVLAQQLRHYAGRTDVLVLALPRGGVPVAAEVARAVAAPLDVFLVRKLGLPGQPELAMGAIASGGVRVLNADVVRWAGVTDRTIDVVASDEQAELERRERQYRAGLPPIDIRNRIVILVDDGLATGSTMEAAVRAVRQLNAARVVVAAPVGAIDTCRRLSELADEVICARTPAQFSAVGQWYLDFSQTTDAEVDALLSQARVGPSVSHP